MNGNLIFCFLVFYFIFLIPLSKRVYLKHCKCSIKITELIEKKKNPANLKTNIKVVNRSQFVTYQRKKKNDRFSLRLIPADITNVPELSVANLCLSSSLKKYVLSQHFFSKS